VRLQPLGVGEEGGGGGGALVVLLLLQALEGPRGGLGGGGGRRLRECGRSAEQQGQRPGPPAAAWASVIPVGISRGRGRAPPPPRGRADCEQVVGARDEAREGGAVEPRLGV
jgi:hypothetical protein